MYQLFIWFKFIKDDYTLFICLQVIFSIINTYFIN